jgi:hypothetical protein
VRGGWGGDCINSNINDEWSKEQDERGVRQATMLGTVAASGRSIQRHAEASIATMRPDVQSRRRRCMTRPSQPTPCPEAVMLPPSRSFRRLRAPSLRPAMRDNTMSRQTFVGARHQWSAQNRGRLRAGAKQHHRLRDTHSRKTSEERVQRGLKGPRKHDEHAKQYRFLR